MEQIAKVERDGRAYLIFEGQGAFWVVHPKFVSPIFPHGFALHEALKRDSEEAAMRAAVDRIGVDKIIDETGLDRLDAMVKYYFG